MTKAERLKQKGDIQGLVAILNNKRNWMLSLDAAEALVQLEDERGLNYLINALDNPNIDIREIAREILEGLDVPQGNMELELHPLDLFNSNSEVNANWKTKFKQFRDVPVIQEKRTTKNFGIEWLIASVAGYLIGDIIFLLLLFPIIFLEKFELSFIPKSFFTDVHTIWALKQTFLDIYSNFTNLRTSLVSLIVEGVTIGSLQQFTLKRYGFQIKSWTLATICGWALGFIISQEASWSIASLLVDVRGRYFELHFFLGYTLFGLFLGIIIGLCQGIVLKKVGKQNIAYWMLINMTAWGLAYFFSEVIIDKIFWAVAGYPPSLHDSRFDMNNSILRISELVIGTMIIGIILFRRLQQRTSQTIIE